MYVQDLYLLHNIGYSIHLDGDRKTFIMEHLDKKIKGILGIKKESRSSK